MPIMTLLNEIARTILFIGVVTFSFAACDSTVPEIDQRTKSTTKLKGLTLLDWSTRGYQSDFAQEQLQIIRELGSSHIGIIVTYYQDGPDSELIEATNRTSSRASLEVVLENASELGFEVIVKPHIDLEDGSSRTSIDPSSSETWFRNYTDIILPLAELAEEYSASHFVVGTELSRMIRYESEWRTLISEVRQRFSGTLVYAANWDEVYDVPFWDALDLLGVDFYYPITNQRNPTRLELLENWQLWLNRLSQLHSQTSKNILFTEIGYRSIDGAGIRPFDFTASADPDLEEQADLYWAAIEATADQEWIEGLLWWGWPAFRERSSVSATGYSPKNKPAQEILRESWQ